MRSDLLPLKLLGETSWLLVGLLRNQQMRHTKLPVQLVIHLKKLQRQQEKEYIQQCIEKDEQANREDKAKALALLRDPQFFVFPGVRKALEAYDGAYSSEAERLARSRSWRILEEVEA